MPKTSHIIIDTTGATRLHQVYAETDTADTGRSPGALSAAWHEIGWSRAIHRWETIANRLSEDCDLDERDIIDAESAAAAYRASGKPIPVELARFLAAEGLAPGAAGASDTP